MLGLALTVAALALCAACCPVQAEPDRPKWADQYKVSFNFSVPYVSTLQSEGLLYTYDALQDWANSKQKVTRDGLETVIIRVEDDIMYELFPAGDAFKCWKEHVHGGTGPTQRRRLSATGGRGSGALFSDGSPASLAKDRPQNYLTFVLPDLEEKRWKYVGKEAYGPDEVHARVWEWDLSEGDMSMTYRFYTDKEGRPLRLYMMGVNLYTGGHKDEYIATYFNYQPLESIPEEEFAEPAGLECVDTSDDAESTSRSAGTSGKVLQHSGRPISPRQFLSKALPNVHWGDAVYDRFSAAHGRRHAHADDYEHRRREFHANAKYISEWNAGASAESESEQGGTAPRHRLAVNHLADWTRGEYLSLLGRRPRAADALEQTTLTYGPSFFVPAEVSWKGSPADSPVKDQAACGSCWAFSSVAPFEAALFRTQGRQQLLSEQNLIDCTWAAPTNNTGCFGGEQLPAIDWVFRRGGLAPLDAYQYRGVNDFCRQDAPVVPLAGSVVAVAGGEDGLKAALAAKGPVAVSVDAEADSFRFYAGGVYSNPDCATAAADLNHAVIASGYGTSHSGTPYWLVKNIWSPFWGEEGYIRIARTPNDCGISTQPFFVLLQGEYL